MGWLKAEPQLIQTPAHLGDAADHAEPVAPREEMDVPAFGQTVMGTRVLGMTVTTVQVEIDQGFEFCPLLARAGYPLMLKRDMEAEPEARGPLSDDERALKRHVYRLMSAPGEGLSMLWTCRGDDVRLPPLIAVRADGEPFHKHEWKRIREFYEDYAPMDMHLAEIDAVPHPDMCRTMEDFEAKMKKHFAPRIYNYGPPKAPTLEDRFPIDSRVEAQDLKKTELNSLVGVVRRYDEAKGRVGVEFPPPVGLLSLQPKNLIPIKPTGDDD